MGEKIATLSRDLATRLYELGFGNQATCKVIAKEVGGWLTDSLFLGQAIRLGDVGLLVPTLKPSRKRYDQNKRSVVVEPTKRTVKLRLARQFKRDFAKGKQVPGKLRPPPPAGTHVPFKDCTPGGQDAEGKSER